MNSWYHAQASAKKWGGKPEDYMAIHEFIDSSKSSVPDMRHRAMLHSAWGIFLVEKVFGATHTVPGEHRDKRIPTRLIAEQHVIEDLGFIPTMADWLDQMSLKPWMSGTRKKKTISMEAFVGGNVRWSPRGGGEGQEPQVGEPPSGAESRGLQATA